MILSLAWIGFVLLSATYAAAIGLPGDHFKALGKHLPIALGPVVAVAFAFWRLRRETILVAFVSGLAIGATVLLIRNGAISLIAGELAEPDRAFLGHINRNTAGLACGLLMISAATLLQNVVLQKPLGLVFTACSAAALGAAIIFAELLLISLQSRTALIATGIAAATWFGAQLRYASGRDASSRRYRYAAIALLAALVIVCATNWSTMTQRFGGLMTVAVGIGRSLDQLGASGPDRLALTALALELIQQRPLLGWGPDVSRLPYLFAQTSGVKSLTQFHNGYLQILVNFGAIGAVLMTALLVAALRAAVRYPGSLPAAPFSGALAITAYITVSNITESVLFVKLAGASAMILIALACMPAFSRRLSQQPAAN
ncbi:O-antigen ligase family protein [Bradyrhizobium sp. BRP23]|uniref:O-antigen ligase family protein n=1 Tax=Bradyrhizobium sp. BRP23 TaxID=2793820 RepID=UPI001CD3581E|nr:O-antigen ligase family protein [Bradyrhizobium sp. BRP23]MCA1381316.1 O-antigen ligase family protein [Bradyrhizobium sp. BRP05]MCA1422427.1 O-antigen ligase family protein [Bradyrhizobium sp. BRP23]